MTAAWEARIRDMGLDGVLRQLTDLVVRSVGACDLAFVSLVGDGGPLTATSATDPFGDLPAGPDGQDQGPAADAARTGLVQHSDAVGDDPRWPGLAAAARRHGLCGAFALPIYVDEVPVAVLSVYSRRPGALDESHRSAAEVFAGLAALVIANARLAAAGRRMSDELYARLADGEDVIDQACGVLMARGRLDAAAAGRALADEARRHGRTVIQEATAVVASTSAVAG